MDKTKREMIFQDLQIGIRCISEFGIDNEVYGSICRVRKSGGSKEICYSFDEYSYHYVMLHESTPIGAMTTTRMPDGPLDCQQHYPMGVLQRFRHIACSNCKFQIVDGGVENRLAAMLRMVRAVWKDQLSLGTRLDIINAKRDMVRFYKRLGYHPLPAHDFVHPTLGTDSVVLVLSADPNWESYFQPLFRDLPDPLPMPRVLAEIDPFDRA